MMFVQDVDVMNVNDIYEGWGWLDWSGKEMEQKYIPMLKDLLIYIPKKRLIAKLHKQFPDIKPLTLKKHTDLLFRKIW